jgi:hypothetical protein
MDAPEDVNIAGHNGHLSAHQPARPCVTSALARRASPDWAAQKAGAGSARHQSSSSAVRADLDDRVERSGEVGVPQCGG